MRMMSSSPSGTRSRTSPTRLTARLPPPIPANQHAFRRTHHPRPHAASFGGRAKQPRQYRNRRLRKRESHIAVDTGQQPACDVIPGGLKVAGDDIALRPKGRKGHVFRRAPFSVVLTLTRTTQDRFTNANGTFGHRQQSMNSQPCRTRGSCQTAREGSKFYQCEPGSNADQALRLLAVVGGAQKFRLHS